MGSLTGARSECPGLGPDTEHKADDGILVVANDAKPTDPAPVNFIVHDLANSINLLRHCFPIMC